MSYSTSYRIGFGGGLTPAIKYLLISNTIVLIFQQFFPIIDNFFSLDAQSILQDFYLWKLVTYMFLHGGVMHLVFNMFMLWMFGCEVERTLGTKEFVKYYLICGIGAGICHMIFTTASVVGASGAIFGVMAAFGVLFPEREITLLLFLILPVHLKAKFFVLIFAGIALLMGIVGMNDGIAHAAHLGGLAVGFVYLKMDWQLSFVGSWLRQRRQSQIVVQSIKKEQAMQDIRERVDQILDKINEVGYEQLSDEEKKILRLASEKFSQDND